MASYFLNPWLLLALAGFSIPIIIELIFRRRRRTVELPTIRYLLKNPAKKKIQRQDRLLLILRCMVPVFLAAALARPLLSPGGGGAAHRHVMLIMDSTLSMGQQVGVSTAFALAKNKATRLVGLLPKGTKLSLIALGHKAEVRLDRSEDLYAARELIDGMKITHGAAPLAEALPQVQQWIERADTGEAQELYVLSDFQKTTVLRKAADGTDPVSALRKICGAAEVNLVDVGGERPFNYYFTDLSPEEPLLTAGRAYRFRATVEAKGVASAADSALRSEAPRSAEQSPRARVTFLVNQVKQDMKEVPLAAGSATVTFDYRFAAAGEYQIETVVEGDTHRLDNHRYYLAAVPESLKVLILDEAGGAVPSPEAAFLAAAISPMERAGLDRSSIFTAKSLHPAEIVRENLAEYSSVIVLGMERVPADLVVKLEAYVRDGGSAIFFLSGRSSPFEYNERLFKDGKGLLTARLDKTADADAGAPLGLKLAAAAHPAFGYFADEKLLPGGEVARYMGLAAEGGTLKTGVVAFFSNGKPAILEGKLGRGKVMTFCTAAGPPDNFLPASFAYPVLLQETLRYLAGAPDRAVNLEIGQTFRQDVMISAQHLILRKPDGVKVRLTPVQTSPEELPTVAFDQTDQMGLYVIDAQAGVVRRPRFVVNLLAVEGDLTPLEQKEAGQLVSAARWVRPGTAIEEVVKGKTATELAGKLLWLLAGLLVLETTLAVRYGMRRH